MSDEYYREEYYSAYYGNYYDAAGYSYPDEEYYDECEHCGRSLYNERDAVECALCGAILCLDCDGSYGCPICEEGDE